MHSQYDEDERLSAYFGSRVGQYVDIGAGGSNESNTFALYQRGWRGLLLDAQRSRIEEARKDRPEDLAEQLALASYDGSIPMVLHMGNCKVRQLAPGGQQLGAVPCICPATFVARFPGFLSPQLASIDIEGAETFVVPAFDWAKFAPEVLVIEFNSYGFCADTRAMWEPAILPFYQPLSANVSNAFYRRRT
jgi:hypothetical protein